MVAVGALLLALLGAVALFGPESVGVSTTSFGVAEKIEAAMELENDLPSDIDLTEAEKGGKPARVASRPKYNRALEHEARDQEHIVDDMAKLQDDLKADAEAEAEEVEAEEVEAEVRRSKPKWPSSKPKMSSKTATLNAIIPGGSDVAVLRSRLSLGPGSSASSRTTAKTLKGKSFPSGFPGSNKITVDTRGHKIKARAIEITGSLRTVKRDVKDFKKQVMDVGQKLNKRGVPVDPRGPGGRVSARDFKKATAKLYKAVDKDNMQRARG